MEEDPKPKPRGKRVAEKQSEKGSRSPSPGHTSNKFTKGGTIKTNKRTSSPNHSQSLKRTVSPTRHSKEEKSLDSLLGDFPGLPASNTHLISSQSAGSKLNLENKVEQKQTIKTGFYKYNIGLH